MGSPASATAPEYTSAAASRRFSTARQGLLKKVAKTLVRGRHARSPGAILRRASGTPPFPAPKPSPGTAGRSFHNCGKSLWTMTLPLAEQSPEAPASAAEVWSAVQDLVKPALSDGSYRMWFAGVEARSV